MAKRVPKSPTAPSSRCSRVDSADHRGAGFVAHTFHVPSHKLTKSNVGDGIRAAFPFVDAVSQSVEPFEDRNWPASLLTSLDGVALDSLWLDLANALEDGSNLICDIATRSSRLDNGSLNRTSSARQNRN